MRAGSVLALLFTLVVLTPAPARAQATEPLPFEKFHAEIGTMWWKPAPELFIQTEGTAAAGLSEFDFAEAFNIHTKFFSEIRAVLKPGRKHKLRFSYVPVRYDETAFLNIPISFDGASFSGTAAVSIAWDLWRFGYEWDFKTTEHGYFGLIADVKYNKVSAAVQSRNAAEAGGGEAPIPGIGVIFRQYVHRNVQVSGEFTAFKISGGVEGQAFDFDVSATANIFKSFGVTGGYRSAKVEYSLDGDSGSLKLNGPYVGIVSRF